MSGAKEIRTKIRSIKNTQKITRAMEMVAASKMRKAQDRMFLSRPYATKIQQVIGHLAKANSEYKHPYLQTRAIKRVGYIVITSDRGLCGGLNTNLLKTTVSAMRAQHQQGIEIDLCLIGSKAEVFFKRHGGNIVANKTHLGDAPAIADLIGAMKIMLKHYTNGTLDNLFIVYNKFVNTMTQQPQIEQLLPLVGATHASPMPEHHWDYLYEPDAQYLLDLLLNRYIESQVYQGVVENLACEQAARMIAMKSASDNAGDLIDDLQLIYNKARQAAITQELSEIVAGAAAV
ncbi:MAG: F0F1 ATP synthase subunit gamma [Gammaproteobacteria bacterium]